MPSINQFTPIIRSVLPRIGSSLKSASIARPINRSYATASAAKSNATHYLLGGLAVTALGGAYYALSGESEVVAAVVEPLDYQKVYNAIAAALDAEDYDDGSYGPALVRLAWHHSGTYDKNTNDGGSNGARMRFLEGAEANHGCNAGLNHARDVLEPIKAQFPQITYSDLWVLAGITAVAEMGGPMTPFRSGRVDGTVDTCTSDGRLPDGDKGSDHIRQIFYKMGFNDQEIVALSGAHAVGRCHTDRSGFDGPWAYSPTTFTNAYFTLLFGEKWSKRKWTGPIQMENKSTKSLMMLTTDMAMITDKAFKVYSQLYAADEAKFFSDFSDAYAKLLELGVPAAQLSAYVPLIKTEDQGKVVA